MASASGERPKKGLMTSRYSHGLAPHATTLTRASKEKMIWTAKLARLEKPENQSSELIDGSDSSPTVTEAKMIVESISTSKAFDSWTSCVHSASPR
jgi:hypothetical protein